MTIRASIYSGLLSGLKSDVLTKWGGVSGPTLLADLDFRTPVTQEFPTTAATLATLLATPAATASYIWTCDETSGNLVDEIASLALEPTGGPLQNRTGAGLWNGSDYISEVCVECLPGGDEFATNDSGVALAAGTTSVAYLCVWRSPAITASSTNLAGKGSTASVYKGHQITFGATTGKLVASMGDGTNTVHLFADNSSTDGAWHATMYVIDRTADVAYLYTDDNPLESASTAAVGDISTTDPFGIGVGRFDSSHQQHAYLAMFEGAAAEALDQDAFDAFWQHASDPTGLLTTQTRASLISVPVSASAVAHFSDDTLPIGYHSALAAGAGGLGAFCNNAVTNLVDESEALSNWTSAFVTETDNFGDSPDGFRTATKLAATADNGYSANTFTSVASTEYTLSVWIKEITVGCTGRLILYDETGTAEIAATTFTATSGWVLETLTATTAVGQVSSSLRIEIDTNTEEICAWGAQANLGDGRGAYIRTSGSTAALTISRYLATGNYVQETAGEVHASGARVKTAANVTLFTTPTGADHRVVSWATTSRITSVMRNAASGIEFNKTPLTTYAADAISNMRLVWDESASGIDGWKGVLYDTVNDVETDGDASPWGGASGGGYTASIEVGGQNVAGRNFGGFIEFVRCYDGQNGDFA